MEVTAGTFDESQERGKRNVRRRSGTVSLGLAIQYDRAEVETSSFIDRYMPGYIFFDPPSASRREGDPPPWLGKGLRILLGEDRCPVKTEIF